MSRSSLIPESNATGLRIFFNNPLSGISSSTVLIIKGSNCIVVHWTQNLMNGGLLEITSTF